MAEATRAQSTTDSTRYATARSSAPVAETASRPLREWLVPILGPSQNLFAELLLKQVARRVTGEGSWRAGLDLERRFLIDSVRVDSTQFSFRDGSGLSKGNVASPIVEGRVRAKTGSVFRANALSGYVVLPNGRVRVFSIQTNNHDGAGRFEVGYGEVPGGATIRYRSSDSRLVDTLHRWFEAQRMDHGV